MFESTLASENVFQLVVGSQGNTTIAGLHQGVQGMLVNGRRVIVVPPSLGYGDNGLDNKVPGGSTLIYQVDLLGVKQPEPEQVRKSCITLYRHHMTDCWGLGEETRCY